MPNVILTDRFVDDTSNVWSDRFLEHIHTAVKLIESYPRMGSTDVPQSIRREFGESMRKYMVAPFDLVYEYNEVTDEVVVSGLVPCSHAT